MGVISLKPAALCQDLAKLSILFGPPIARRELNLAVTDERRLNKPSGTLRGCEVADDESMACSGTESSEPAEEARPRLYASQLWGELLLRPLILGVMWNSTGGKRKAVI
jgi:hypothetical protein